MINVVHTINNIMQTSLQLVQSFKKSEIPILM